VHYAEGEDRYLILKLLAFLIEEKDGKISCRKTIEGLNMLKDKNIN